MQGVYFHIMRNKIRLFFCALCFFCINEGVVGQEKFTEYKKQELKKKKEGFGIKKDGDWAVPAEYDKIEQKDFKLFAWKGDKVDIYREYYLNLIFKDIFIKDTSFLFSFTRFEGVPAPVYENKRWGWKYKDKSIAAEYDSIRMISASDVQVYKNGKTGILKSDGSPVISLANYVSIVPAFNYYQTYKKDSASGQLLQGRFESQKKEIPASYTTIEYIQEQNDIYYDNDKIKYFFAAKQINGEFEYYSASTLSKLPESFYKIYSPKMTERLLQMQIKEKAERKKYETIETRASLRIFRDGNKGLGLITSSGKIYMPAGLTKISFRTVSWTVGNSVKGLNRSEYTIENGRKTVKSQIFDTDTTMLYTDKSFATFPLKVAIRNVDDYYLLALDHEFTKPVLLAVSCDYCKAGKITAVYSEETKTREIAPSSKFTVTQKKVSADLDKYGKFPVYSKTYEFDAITETIKTTKQISSEKNCAICNGTGLRYLVLQWNEKEGYKEMLIK